MAHGGEFPIKVLRLGRKFKCRRVDLFDYLGVSSDGIPGATQKPPEPTRRPDLAPADGVATAMSWWLCLSSSRWGFVGAAPDTTAGLAVLRVGVSAERGAQLS